MGLTDQQSEGSQTEGASPFGQLQEDITHDRAVAIENNLEKMDSIVKEENIDLASDATLSQIKLNLEQFLTACPQSAPENLFIEWMNAATTFLIDEFNEYDEPFDSLTIQETNKIFAALKDRAAKGESGKNGIGNFEEWFSATHHNQYLEWRAEQDAILDEQDEQQANEAWKKPVYERITKLEQTLAAFPFASIRTNELLTTLRTQLDAAADPQIVSSYETSLTELETYGVQLQELQKTLDTPEVQKIPQEKRDEILIAVREDKKTPEEAIQELKKLETPEEKPAETPPAAAAPVEALPALTDEELQYEDNTAVGTIQSWAEEYIPEEGFLSNFKKPILAIAAGLSALVLTLSKRFPILRKFLCGNLVSNKTLAEKYNDPDALKAYKTELVFLKFGVPQELANEVGSEKTPKAIDILRKKAAAIKPAEDADEATKAEAEGMRNKILNLAQTISDEGKKDPGTTTEAANSTLFAFVAGREWTVPKPKRAPAAAEPAATAAAEPKPQETPEIRTQKTLGSLTQNMTPDDRHALETAKVKELAEGKLPQSLANNERAKKIVEKLKANGAAQITDSEKTVSAFIQENLDKIWEIA